MLSRRSRRLALTLIEIMVSVTLTLIIMVTVMAMFSLITRAVADNRSRMEMVDRVASVCTRLIADLQGHTVHTLPPRRLESAEGYLVYAEGAGTDRQPITDRNQSRIGNDIIVRDLARPESRVLGDVDDVLMLTVRSRGAPFTGRGQDNQIIESSLAEVIWWVAPLETDSEARPLALYRRALLIVPQEKVPGTAGGSPEEFFQKFDISAHYDTQTGKWVANTLADLTMPENRAFHYGTPGKGDIYKVRVDRIKPFPRSSERYGEDVMLVNCAGFDIKAFDARAAITGNPDPQGDVALVPGDFGYPGGGAQFRGAYVDIGVEAGGNSGGDFNRPMHQLSGMSSLSQEGLIRAVYDTYSFHFEHDGFTQGGQRDAATDLKDLDSGGGIDDAGERETAPPYAVALRGLQVKVRAYEERTRQVHETTVVGQFMPN